MPAAADFIVRFAPSPSGFLHLGNARAALFNWLAARAQGGKMLLRLEDTDSARTDDSLAAAVGEDLNWLGLTWQGDSNGAPLRQSQNRRRHQESLESLVAADLAYPCFCPPEQLQQERERQLRAGKPPRYSGRCAGLSAAEGKKRMDGGEKAAIRFRMPPDSIVFEDAVRGEMRFDGADIGDFILRRAGGDFAFFFANAVDDAAEKVSLALRGEDHLANTPRQIALLRALQQSPPQYGHMPLMRAAGGGMLSKRDGSLSVRDLRRRGFLPLAVVNYLARAGCVFENNALLSLDDLAAEFSLSRMGRSAAMFDEGQLNHRQKETALSLSGRERTAWLSAAIPQIADKDAFCAAVGENIALFADAEEWAQIIAADSPPPMTPAARQAIKDAGESFYPTAAAALQSKQSATNKMEWKEFCEIIAAATDKKGRALFLPLRAALTGKTEGPAMPPLFQLITLAKAQARLQAAANLADNS